MSFLESPTLVLNRNWMAIDATPARDALCDVFVEKAKIVCPENYELYNIQDWMKLKVSKDQPHITTTNCNIRVPEIIVNHYARIPQRKVIFSRRNLWRRDNFHCQFCGKRPPYDEITIDHLLPKSRGGKTTFENCVLACIDCNKKKNDRTPQQAGMALRRMVLENGIYKTRYYAAPNRPRWNPAYAVKRKDIPQSWAKFLEGIVEDLYWNCELLPE